MKKLLSRWIAAVLIGVMVVSSGVTGTAQAAERYVEITEENLQIDTEKNNSEIEGDLSVGDNETFQKEDNFVTEENNATESEIIGEVPFLFLLSLLILTLLRPPYFQSFPPHSLHLQSLLLLSPIL